jgi:cytosine/adenosine deaminase-related metal-dependent hydrolase
MLLLTILGHASTVEILSSYGLLDSSVLLAHATNPLPTDIAIIESANAHVSSTPSTELQMALGVPIAFDIPHHCSLGVDCHTSTTCSIPNEMRILLQSARGTYNEPYMAAQKVSNKVFSSVMEVFNFGTIGGARAVGMEDSIGSLAVGKKADIVVFDALSPSMTAAAQHDPVSAIVLHSGVRDVVMTIVDGVVRKDDGKLLTIKLGEEDAKWVGDVGTKGVLEWRDVAREIVKRREVLQTKIEKLDMEAGRAGLLKAFYVNPDVVVDSL